MKLVTAIINPFKLDVAKVVIFPKIEGHSTTELINKISNKG